MADFRGILREKKLSREAISVLVNYSWPGNVREIRSVLTRVGIEYEGEEISAEIVGFFERDFSPSSVVNGNEKLDRIWRKLKAGKTFWEVVKEPFMKRDLCRDDVKMIIQRGLKESLGKHMKNALPILNVPSQELKKFLDFINDYHVK